MLTEYYTVQGWDAHTGRQTRDGLCKLGLTDVAEKLGHAGRLSESGTANRPVGEHTSQAT